MEPPDVPWRGRDALYVGIVYFLLLLFLLTRGAEEGEVAALLLTVTLLLGLVTLGWARLYRSVGKLFGSNFRFTGLTGIVGLALGGGLVAVRLALEWIVAELSGVELVPSTELFVPIEDRTSEVLIVLSLVLAAPFAEEVFFRGFLLQGLWKSFGAAPAVIVSSVIFGLGHPGGTLIATVISISGAIIVGVVLGWLFIRYRNLALTITVHASSNAIAALLLF